MKYSYHVFTPLARFQNLLFLTKRLKACGVQWHPILDAEVPFSITGDWIHPMVCPTREPGWFMGHWYQNWWVEHAEIVDDHRYIMLSDDDDYQAGFFELMDAAEGDVLICSMKRPGDVLYARPENLQRNLMGGEQIMVAGRILKQCRWSSGYSGDWDFIAAAIALCPPVFVHQAVVWWNILDTAKPKDFP